MHLFLIGAGHVGLVTAVGLARLGHRLTVADIDQARIDGLREGIAPVYEPGLEEAIRDGLAGGALEFTTDLAPPLGTAFSFAPAPPPPAPAGPPSPPNVRPW